MNKYILPLLLYCGLLTWSGCEESYPSAPKNSRDCRPNSSKLSCKEDQFDGYLRAFYAVV